MLNLTDKSATKIGLLVTSIVLLGACSAKQVKQEAQAYQTPEPIVEESYNQAAAEYQAANPEVEPATYSAPVKSPKVAKKKKFKHASVKAKKSKRSSKVAKHAAKKRHEPKQAAVAQIEDMNTPSNGSGNVPPVMEQAPAPVIPPPPFMEQAPVETDSSARIGLWATVLAAALVLCGLAYRVRRGKGTQRRLVFNR